MSCLGRRVVESLCEGIGMIAGFALDRELITCILCLGALVRLTTPASWYTAVGWNTSTQH